MKQTQGLAEMTSSTPKKSVGASLRATLRKALPFIRARQTSAKRTMSRRERFEALRAKKGEAHCITYFHDVTDPASHLTAQVLERLTRTYEIELRIMLVSPAADAFVPARELYEVQACKDAGDIADHYNLEFEIPSNAHEIRRPDALAFEMAGRLLSASLARSSFAEDAPRIGAQLWNGGSAALNALTGELPMAELALNERHISEGDAERERQNHYSGALFAYGEECYVGIERLYHLEQRLVELGVRNGWSAPKIIVRRRAETAELIERKPEGIVLEFFAAVQDPHSYIVMERTFRLAQQYGLKLEMRPILPVEERGGTPRALRQYTLFDAKREADAAGVPFGRISDPAGKPVERLYALYPWARQQGLGNELLLSFARAAFAEGIDGGTDEGMRVIVERVGLDGDAALGRLGNEEWRVEFEGNRTSLFQEGLWQAPGFRLEGGEVEGAFVTAGQDRLWLIEAQVRRRMGVRRNMGLLTG